MEFKNQVYGIIAEVCQDDVVKENPEIAIFEEGLLDSFGTVELLMAIESQLELWFQLQNLIVMCGIHRITLLSSWQR